ncbi:MAG: hypothetical protein BJ554DRAFT_1603, partial [Olpidium bornovanus]
HAGRHRGRASRWVTVRASGGTGHGSRFIEDLASDKLMRIIERFRKFREEQKKLLEIGVTTDGKRFKLGDVTTVNMTGLGAFTNNRTRWALRQGGVQHNVVPMEVTANFDIRVAPTMNLDDFKARIESWMEPGCVSRFREMCTSVLEFAGCFACNLEFVRCHFDNTTTSIAGNDPWWSKFADACAAGGFEIETEIFPAATAYGVIANGVLGAAEIGIERCPYFLFRRRADSRFLREIGLPALGVSPINHPPVLLHDHNGASAVCSGRVLSGPGGPTEADLIHYALLLYPVLPRVPQREGVPARNRILRKYYPCAGEQGPRLKDNERGHGS